MANEYATLAELKSMRRITHTNDDTDLQNALTRASRAIDTRTGRRFYADGTATARTYKVNNRTVWTQDGEILLVDDISTDSGLIVEIGDGTSFGTITDYFVEPDNALNIGRPVTGLLRNLGQWCYVGSRARITAKWGWPAVPDDIVTATLLLANRRYMRKDSPEGVSGWNQEGPIRVSRFDPDVEDLVGPYVIPGIA